VGLGEIVGVVGFWVDLGVERAGMARGSWGLGCWAI